MAGRERREGKTKKLWYLRRQERDFQKEKAIHGIKCCWESGKIKTPCHRSKEQDENEEYRERFRGRRGERELLGT